ncbi:MAG TPA: tetratricopeptide repeat protein, partial [Gemmatimonadaceae bacterium]|nr:tetratricopeptide repeat protein [Gemmatimonadaceae bacterium]
MVDSTDSYETLLAAAGDAFAAGDAASLERAESLYRQALTAGERSVGYDDLALLPALTGLGSTLILRTRADEAEPILNRAIALGEQLGTDHPDVVILLNDLSRLYLKQSAHRYAEPLLQRLLEIKRAKGEEHPEVATVLASLASVRQSLGRYEEAEQLWRRVLAIREATLAPNHFAIATAVEHLGATCAARGKVREAVNLFQHALAMREASLGADHPSLRPARERIADLQLQASEDSLEDAPAAPTQPRLAIPRAPIVPTLSASPAAPITPPRLSPVPPTRKETAARRETVPVVEREVVPVMEREVAPAPVVIPTSTALTIPAAAATPATVPYMNVLMDIKDEFEEETPAPETEQPRKLAAIALLFRERRAAAIAAIAVVALPLTGLGAYALVKANRGPVWVSQPAFANAPVRDTTASAALAAAAIAAADAARDSAATHAPAPRTKVAEPAPKRSTESSEDAIRIPIMTRPAPGRMDSVLRSINVPSQAIGESYQVQLQASLAAGQKEVASALQASIPARRAQLIGNPPVPRYPAGVAQSGIGGEVR